VITDVEALASFPVREFRAGLAEVVKIAAIRDRDLFEYLEKNVEEVLSQDLRALVRFVRRACEIKASIVEADEWETDVRSILNFGHTVGHAVEAALGYGVVTHGEAVAYGMLVAASLSVRRGVCPPRDAARLEALLRRFGLVPGSVPSPELLEKYLVRDKKVRDGVVQFVLTPGVGNVTLAPISDWKDLRNALHDMQA
jgi:3-dehydroquinate synthase